MAGRLQSLADSLQAEWRSLAELTTFHIGGEARVVDAPDQNTLIRAIHTADEQHIPLLVLGGGSNVLVNDAEDFPGLVLRDARTDLEVLNEPIELQPQSATRMSYGAAVFNRVLVRASAGTSWDKLVEWSLANGLSGLEALSGIPGTVGAAPVQNVGAYGHDISETVVSVHAWDRQYHHEVTLTPTDLDFSYRMSALKKSLPPADAAQPNSWWGRTGRWVVLDVTFSLESSPLSAPIMYSQLAQYLGVQPGHRVPSGEVRDAVLALRASKGMVVDPTDHDTWSAGSFFTNPIVPADFSLPADAPVFPAEEGLVKTSAAWLIDHAGFSRGCGLDDASMLLSDMSTGELARDTNASHSVEAEQARGTCHPARVASPPLEPVATLSTKHVLALTNRGHASASDICALARAVRSGVNERFGVMLIPEPVGVGLVI